MKNFNLTEFWKRHRQTIAIGIVAALSIYSLWMSSRAPTVGEVAEIAAARVTATQSAGRSTPTPKPSGTPVLPTATKTTVPAVTLTVGPPTPTVTGSGEIDDTLPLCEDHDPYKWHGLVEFDGGGKAVCHYDHEHKHNPMEGCAGELFGEPGAWYGMPGQSISYPWQTILETEHKHEAYGWVVRCDVPPDELPDKANFVKAFRAEVHVDPMCFLMPAGNWAGCHIGSQHSFMIEVQICKKSDPNDCGIFQFGGWINVGDLNLRDENGENITFCAPLPDVSPLCDPAGQTGGGDGGSRIYVDAAGPPFNPNARAHSFFWYGEMSTSDVQSIEVINPTVFAVAMGDSMHEVSLDNLLFEDPIKSVFCPDMQCPFNGSTISMHEISLFVPAKLDPNGDGYVDGVFWVDQYGRLTPECMELTSVINPGDLACIPWKFSHVPLGAVKFGDPENLGIGVMGSQDFDLSPAFTGTGSQWWITWPLKMLDGLMEDH